MEMIKINKITNAEFLRNLLIATKKQALRQIEKYCNTNCDQTRKMRITKVIDNNNYIVKYNDKEYKAFSRFQHKLGDIVYVTICCGNMNDLIIN